MKYLLTFIVISIGFMSCSTSTETSDTQSTPTLDSLLANYHEERLKLYPIEATMAGDNRYNDLLPNDISQEFRDQIKKFYTQYKTALQTYDRESLSENDQMSYDILMWECDINLEELGFKKYLTPVNQFSAQHLTIGQLASGSSFQPFKTVADYQNWLSRLDAYVVWCDTAIANMKKGMATGYVLPKVLTEKMIPQFKDLAKTPAEENLFYSPIKNFPESFTEEEKSQLTTAYKTMITEKIIPTHKAMTDFLVKEYLPACRTTSGISDTPDGAAFYDHAIKQYTTTTMSAKEIFDLGNQEVARIESEMMAIKDQVGYTGDLKSFFTHLRERKELMPFKTADEVIANFNAIHETMKPNLSKLFSTSPKTPFEVKRTEAFREASASAEYNPGSVDGTRPGIFYVPVPDAKTYNVLSDEDLFLHEAIPGHHYQISLQQEDQSLPEFRKTLWYSAYGEGWALYSESLGKELGLYTDPYQYFGMLSAEMHRAIRLVVDAGMHTQGWTREQAIQFSLDHEAESESSIIAEIERYMSWPGQALSYKIGQLKIRELRAKAESELKDQFNIGEFHTKVLESGCLPLSVLEKKINAWMESKKVNQ